MKFLSSLLEKISSSNKEVKKETLNSFDDHLVLSTCILLLEVAKSDDNFDEAEKQKILTISKKNFDLSDEQTNLLLDIANTKNEEMISLYEWTSKINDCCTYSDKKKLMEDLWEVAFADQVIDKYEDYTIRKIADLLYVKHKDFIKAKIR
ncbi:MAG: TerB family tellurite resistance protein [Pseudomonadota bacterium]|nr:TerB family tellurite resistance protein [Pseudomonadota bacterium]